MAATHKKSFSIGRNEMRWLSWFSKRHKISASAAVSQAIRLLREEETAKRQRECAAREFLASYGADEHASAEEEKELLKKWG